MATYQTKAETVEARQYEGDSSLTVVHYQKGEQVAQKGDWLVGSERGCIYVVPDDEFQTKFVAYSPTLTDDQLKAANAQVAALTAQVASVQQSLNEAQAQAATLQTTNQNLAGQVGDTLALSGQVSQLSEALAAAKAQAADDEKKLADLSAQVKQYASAQSALEASQAAIKATLNP